jgi:hypothetical protein
MVSIKQWGRALLLCLNVVCCVIVFSCRAAAQHEPQSIYQYHTTIAYQNDRNETKSTAAYLWVPPACKRLAGVVVTSQNVLEQWLVEHPLFRQACTKANLGILWSCPGFFADGPTHNPELNLQTLQRLLDSLAAQSGFAELQHIPWLPVGHSGTNNLVGMLVKTVPHKLIAAIKMKGGPGFGNTTVPVMCNGGEYFEWKQHKEDLVNPRTSMPMYNSVLAERAETSNALSFFFDPHTGHFDCSEQLTQQVVDYVLAACEARINPANDTALLTVNLNNGWVAALPLPGAEAGILKPYSQASASERRLPWYFTKQQAMDAVKMASVNFNRKAQMAGFANADGSPAGFNRGIVWPIPYTTGDDGVTFTLKPVFLNAIPDTFAQAGTPLGHNHYQPNVVLLCGNATYIKPYTFRITPGRSYKGSATYFLIKQPGDETYRSAVQPGQLVITPNTAGTPQTIVFNALPNIKAGTRTIVLQASASSGMPVDYYVKSGPAYIYGNTLHIAEVPARAVYPLRVTVVAYQWGRSTSPAIQTAPFVERSFYITR